MTNGQNKSDDPGGGSLALSTEPGRADLAMLYAVLDHEHWGISELRALGDGPPEVAYVDSVDTFVDLAMVANGRGFNVYVGLQPRALGMFDHAPNCWKRACSGTDRNAANGGDIEYITNVAFDIDVATPPRLNGAPATDSELDRCIDVARQVIGMEGFAGTTSLAISGNGVLVINPIAAVAVEAGTAETLKQLERVWIDRLQVPQSVRVDPILDLPRIIRAIGTVNLKGQPGKNRPHRRSRFITPAMIGGRQGLIAEQLKLAAVQTNHTVSPRTDASNHKLLRGDLDRFATCEFVQWVRSSATQIPEPAWMDFLVQCAWLLGGDDLAHNVSAIDRSRYSWKDTAFRLNRIRNAGYKPKRCDSLSGQSGTFCCPQFPNCPASRPIELAALATQPGGNDMNKPTETQGKRPHYVARCGAITATAWTSTRKQDGELREYIQVEVARNYRNADGEWQRSNRFWPEELPALQVVIQKAMQQLAVAENHPTAASSLPHNRQGAPNDTR